MRAAIAGCLLLLVGLALGCASPPPAPSGLTSEQQRIYALLETINFPKFAQKLQKASLRVAGFPRDGELPEDQRLRTRIETQLAPEAVVKDVVVRVSASFNEAYVAELERFDASALGRKVGDAADVPYSWFSQLGYRMFGSETGGPPERVALVEKLDALTHSSQASTDAYMTVYAAIVRWYDTKGFINDDESAAVGGTDALIAREHEKVDAVVAQHTIPFGLYALSDLSTPELTEYVTQAGTPASQWFAKAVREALAESIQTRAAEIAR